MSHGRLIISPPVYDGYASLYPSYGLPGDMEQLISASINKKISVGRVISLLIIL